MTFKVFLINQVPATPHKELLKEFPKYEEAEKYGYEYAKGYCNDYEKPEIIKVDEGVLIDTPCDWGIFIKEE